MNIDVTKTFARELQKQVNPLGYRASYCECSWRDYVLNVSCRDSYYTAAQNPKTGNFAYIEISYPDIYYAMPQRLTRRDLKRLYINSDKTWGGFWATVKNEIEI